MDRMPMPGKEPTHAIAACESECDLCCERIFEGDAVCDVGTGWAHLDCALIGWNVDLTPCAHLGLRIVR